MRTSARLRIQVGTLGIALLAAAAAQGCSSDTVRQASASEPPARRAGGVHDGRAPAAGTAVGDMPAGGAGDWTLPGRDYAASRFSPLDRITAQNVKNLKVAWTFSTGVVDGHEGNPLVVNNTMYVVTPFPNYLYALDLTKPGPALKWVYKPKPEPAAAGEACCDAVNRGMSYADGKIIYNVLDDHTVAVDASTGKEVWNVKLDSINEGATMTMAPLVVNDKVLVGNSGAEMGVRGFLAALDVKTGKLVWQAYSTGPDSAVKIGPDFKPFYARLKGKDLGVTTWPPDQWKLGGGTAWGWVSYDPELNLIYYGTANPGVWNPDQRPGDNLWGASVFARDPDTGEAKWAYQMTPHDAWDYDGVNEFTPVDLTIDGRPRKVVVHFDRNGFAYTLDRATGQVLVANPYVPGVNWATGVDLKTGRPRVVDSKRTHQGVNTHDICPASIGARDEQPSAFSPRTQLFYTGTNNACMNYAGSEASYIAGTPYLGADVVMYAGPGGNRGEFIAWDPVAGKKVWGIKENFPVWSGVLATAGDVVFYGTMDGWFKAVNARSGQLLWQQKLGSGIVGYPMTYLGPDGKQYVAVYAGVGGWVGAIVPGNLSPDDPSAALGAVGLVPDLPTQTSAGGMLYVFSL